MESTKPIDKLAVRFNLSRESAKYFVGRVQKAFKTEKPPYKVIMDFIERQAIEGLPQAQQLALLMKEGGAWPHELTTLIPPETQQVDASRGAQAAPIRRRDSAGRDRNAKSTPQTLCPHGIPRNRVCADCEFEAFERLTKNE